MDAETCEKLRLLVQYLKNLPDTIPMVDASATEYFSTLLPTRILQTGASCGACIHIWEDFGGCQGDRSKNQLTSGTYYEYNSVDNSGSRREKATKTKSKKPAKLDSKILANYDDVRYVDLPEPKDNGKGGTKTRPHLLELRLTEISPAG
ncbi:hypothetical protein AZE42_02390 [Rhizopogon vesiculosus]|uniref:Uncharacterized protein n=1 Tax=Rhizopogon vesiculosus TaxID=180088 RepID=A0A1J8PRI5_9AGAM|nr:hypothetical protein AZE42_02390 [Rhizopogon vesiculosus]